jgi:nucleoid DNA-binding protein
MDAKLNQSDLISLLAKGSNISVAKAEQFTKNFFDLIIEGLEKDGIVKINGLGTFKVTDVASRGSVNVNTGEKIEIKGHKKLVFIPADALKDSYTEFKNVSSDAAVTVDITNISLTLNGIKIKVKIPLNTEDATEKMEATVQTNKIYKDFHRVTGIKYYLVENADGTYTVLDPTSLVGDEELLILIPQEEDITAAIEVKYTVNCGGISKSFSFNTANQQTKVDITINGLESGYYHYLLLNITKSGLFVEAKKNTSWVNQEKVEHTFE